jgi:hypothetical protein
VLVILLSFISKLQHALLSPQCSKPGSMPQLLALLLFSFQTHFEFSKEVGNALYTNGGFLSIYLKNTFTKFLTIMDQMLTHFNFSKYNINGIIIFSLTLKNHNMHHLQVVFGKLNEHKFKFHLSKCWFFHIQI